MVSDLLECVAKTIKDLRTGYGDIGISQEALAKALEVAPNTISRWETGAYKPDLNDLEKIARFFNKSIMTFFPQELTPVKKETEALLRAAEALPAEDVAELQRFAEFRHAQKIHKSIKGTR